MKPILTQTGHIPTAPPPCPIEGDDDDLIVTQLQKPKVTPKKGVTCAKRGRGHREPRHRLRFSFWINILNPMEELVADEIELLKNRRQFASAVRDGIMLISELRQGKIDLLVRLFPWIADCFTPSPVQPVNDVAALKSELDFLKSLVLAQQATRAVGEGQPVKMLTNNIPTAQPAADDDDDALTVTRDASAGARSCQNFLASMEALNSIGVKP